jgi:hypothetical protein
MEQVSMQQGLISTAAPTNVGVCRVCEWRTEPNESLDDVRSDLKVHHELTGHLDTIVDVQVASHA